jgi:hypothetical protein
MTRPFRKGLRRVFGEFDPVPDGPQIVEILQALFLRRHAELRLGARVLFIDNMMRAGLLRNFSVAPGTDQLEAIVDSLSPRGEKPLEHEVDEARQISDPADRLKAAKHLVALVLARLRKRGGSNVGSFASKFVHMHVPWVPLQDRDATRYLRLCIDDSRPKVSTYDDFAEAIYEFVSVVGCTTDKVPQIDRFLVDSWRRLQSEIERAELQQTGDEEMLTENEITNLNRP